MGNTMMKYKRVYVGGQIVALLSLFNLFYKLKMHEVNVTVLNKKVHKDGRQFCQIMIQ